MKRFNQFLIETTTDWGYRGDKISRYQIIKKNGLVPNWDFKRWDDIYGLDINKPYIFFDPDVEAVHQYNRGLLLRFPVPKRTFQLPFGDVTDEIIPPNQIQIFTDEEEWVPIIKSTKIDRTIVRINRKAPTGLDPDEAYKQFLARNQNNIDLS